VIVEDSTFRLFLLQRKFMCEKKNVVMMSPAETPGGILSLKSQVPSSPKSKSLQQYPISHWFEGLSVSGRPKLLARPVHL
jgi:hypothetical protein